MHITDLDLTDTIKALDEKQFSLEELNSAYLERINKVNPELNAYLEVNQESDGIPASIKDVFSTQAIKTTAGSRILEGYTPVFDATVVDKLKRNKISIVGKTNCDEFACGSSGENSGYGESKNPWDLSKVTGGSSSGSVASVAADLCVFSIGTDTGGSIRQPASLSGVVGLKPSYGRVSRYGLISMASSLDCPGPITKSVRDARLVLDWISGSDGLDSNCVDLVTLSKAKGIYSSGSLAHQTDKPLKGLRVGYVSTFSTEAGGTYDTSVHEVVNQAIKKLEDLGAELVEISLPHSEYAVATYYILMSSELSSNLARFDGIRFGKTRDNFGSEIKRRIMLGTFSLSTGYYDDYFNKAAKVRTLIKQDFEKAFEKCDVIAGPVSPTTAWNIGEKISDPLTMYLSDVYTIPASLAGIPGISVPCGFVTGLPVGLQILGPYLREDLVLDVAEAYEGATEWRKEKPQSSS